ncbi:MULTISPECIES: AtuA-related protein [unclassified Cupriavidus]|uniref:AtuA-related protein n=1 Tax=Cupriavidus sp. H19C3 TaxID=3241603 RepID=UPI003BF809AF
MRVPLRRLAHTRSGDKGNTSNTAVIAYAPAFYPHLKAQLTADAFKAHYNGPDDRGQGPLITGPVTRHDVDGLHVLNFVAEGALGGGVSRSLALDNYGKALASAVLRFEVEIPDDLAPLLRGPKH